MGEQYDNKVRSERQRKRLLALMASHVAGDMIALTGYGTEEKNERIADQASDVAERILRRLGL